MKKLLKQHKINQFKNIQQNYKYIYIFRYTDFKISELIQLKKILQKLNYNFCFFKKKLITKKISNLKGQGSILILYSNANSFEKFENLKIFSKIEFLFLIHQNYLYSKFKLIAILNRKKFLNHSLLNYINYFIFFLKKASIT